MDIKALTDGPDGGRTEERHSLSLDWIEASFVRRMLGVPIAGGSGAVPCRPTGMNSSTKLNHYVPDSATESTEDSRRRSPAAMAAAVMDSELRRASIFTGENIRKRPLAHLSASQDQVVPDIENSKDGDGLFAKRKHGCGRF